MNIDREYLEATLRNLRVQEREGIEMAAMARGAIQITEALVARLAEPESLPFQVVGEPVPVLPPSVPSGDS